MKPIPPTMIDGATYVLIAFFGTWATALGTDDAAKYIAPGTLWITKAACSAIAASLLALKMFRSTAFADAKQEKKNGTGFYTKPVDMPATVKTP